MIIKLTSSPLSPKNTCLNSYSADEGRIISPLSHATVAHPSCRSGRGRGSTAGSHPAAAPQWRRCIQTGLQGWVLCTAPWPAQTPGRPTDPHSSWSVTGDRHGGRRVGGGKWSCSSPLSMKYSFTRQAVDMHSTLHAGLIHVALTLMTFNEPAGCCGSNSPVLSHCCGWDWCQRVGVWLWKTFCWKQKPW